MSVRIIAPLRLARMAQNVAHSTTRINVRVHLVLWEPIVPMILTNVKEIHANMGLVTTPTVPTSKSKPFFKITDILNKKSLARSVNDEIYIQISVTCVSSECKFI